MLENLLKEKGFEFVAILEKYEEDRTEEISSVLENKNATYFFATDVEEKINIKNFCKKFNVETLDEVKKVVLESTKRGKKLIVIRNIEKMLSKNCKEFLNFVEELKSENVMFVMLSKYTAAIKELLNEDLANVVTKTIDNETSSIYDILQGKNVKPIDLFTYYSIFGSNKRYLKYIDVNRTLKENLINLILKNDSLFIGETESILKTELRTLQVYNMILLVISKGAKTLSDISESLKLPTSICNKYTTVLVNLGILTKVKPVYDNDTRKSEYRISNKLMDFYYYFVFENMDEISLGREEVLFDEKISVHIDEYLSSKYSLICSEYILKQMMEEKSQITIAENGKWWDREDKIDVIIGDGLKANFANCYWNDSIIGIDEFKKLEKASKKIDVADRKYYIFAKKGFSDELKKIARKRDDLELVDFNTIFEGKKKFLFFK